MLQFFLASLYYPALELAAQVVGRMGDSKTLPWEIVERVQRFSRSPEVPYPGINYDLFSSYISSRQLITLELTNIWPILTLTAKSLPHNEERGILTAVGKAATRAIQLGQELGDASLGAHFLMFLGTTFTRLQEFGKAEDSFRRSIDLLHCVWSDRPGYCLCTIGTAYHCLGVVLTSCGRLEDAEAAFGEASHFRGILKREWGGRFALDVVITESSLAAVLCEMGRRYEAKQALRRAVKTVKIHGTPHEPILISCLIRSMNDLANVLLLENEPVQARIYLTNALHLRDKYADLFPDGLVQLGATILYNLARTCKQLGCVAHSIEYFQRSTIYVCSLMVVDGTRFRVNLARILHGYGAVLAQTGSASAALAVMQNALHLLLCSARKVENHQTSLEGHIRHHIGRIYLERGGIGNIERARRELARATSLSLRIRRSIKNRRYRRFSTSNDLPVLHRYIEALLREWSVTGASTLLWSALTARDQFQAQSLWDVHCRAVVQHSTATPLHLQLEKALERRAQLYRTLPPMSGTESTRRGFENQSFCLAANESEISGLSAIEAEIDAYLNQIYAEGNCELPVPSAPLPIRKQLMELLNRDCDNALLVYALGIKHSYAIVVATGGFIKAVELSNFDITAQFELEDRWAKALEHLNAHPDYWSQTMGPIVSEMAMYVVWPLLPIIPAEVRRLVVIPSHGLNRYPFAAMSVRPSSAEVLCDRYEITYAPSISLWVKACRPIDISEHVVVVEGRSLDLPYVSYEAAQAANACLEQKHSVSHLQWTTRSRVFREVLFARIVHFCGHAYFDSHNSFRVDEIPEGAIQLADGSLTISDLLVNLRLERNELTFLNGCETGVVGSDLLDDLPGITTVFLAAGAKCVIGTNWKVNDLFAALLAGSFYAQFHTGQTASGALWQACRWIQRLSRDQLFTLFDEHVHTGGRRRNLEGIIPSGAYPFSSPIFWAAYVCVGSNVPMRACV